MIFVNFKLPMCLTKNLIDVQVNSFIVFYFFMAYLCGEYLNSKSLTIVIGPMYLLLMWIFFYYHFVLCYSYKTMKFV